MNCFEVLKDVLDEAYNEIEGTEAGKDKQIRAELNRLADLYSDLRTYKDIDYSQPVTRFAYVYRYVTSHANLVYQIIKRSVTLQRLLEREEIEVSCIGGGPGSDLIGLVKYLEEQGSEMRLACNIYDRETAWGETWTGLFQKINSGVNVIPAFNVFDVAEQKSWRKFRKYLQSDLFTMIYFMSEVHGLKDEAEPYFTHLFDEAKKGALVLFVDNRRSNNTTDFSDWFDSLAEKHGLKAVDGDETNFGLPYQEEKQQLGRYFTKFKHPKLNADVAWRVAKKK